MEFKFKDQDNANLAKLLFNLKDERIYNTQIQLFYEQRKTSHPNPFCKYGSKVFSQTDEDGITFEIVRRIKIENKFFIEFGVGKGTENNTLSLLAANWKGVWYGGNDLSVNLENSKKLKFKKIWIKKINIVSLLEDALKYNDNKTIDLISLDLDGNDYYFIKEILSSNYKPKIFIAEYNGKFIPPIEFKIDYDENFEWKGDDYFGASLQTLNNLFRSYDYKLVCCNSATGANAFFVQNEFATEFADVPNNIRDIYVPPNYNLYNYWGHKKSLKTIEKIINE